MKLKIKIQMIQIKKLRLVNFAPLYYVNELLRRLLFHKKYKTFAKLSLSISRVRKKWGFYSRAEDLFGVRL